MSVIIVENDYTKHYHEGEIRLAIEKIHNMGCSVTDIKRVSTITLLWGKNRAEVYYTCPEKCKDER